MPDFARLREDMIEQHIAGRGLRDPALLAAFRAVPREQFVAAEYAAEAYGDHPLPIGVGQTISQPYIVALMADAAGIGRGARVLEVGAGSGYAAAVLGHLAASVIAVERHAELASAARARIARLGLANVTIVDGDGTDGWPQAAPYDAILAAAGARSVPRPLLDQLRCGGRLVIPLGAPGSIQTLAKLTKQADGSVASEDLCPVRFVPLVGA